MRRRAGCPSILLLVLALGVVKAEAQTAPVSQTQPPPRRSMTAIRMSQDEAIVLDGRLDEAVWGRATPASDFIQSDPDTGAPATERTEVRLIYDRTSLYMGIECFDSEPDKWLGFERRRDQGLPSDDRLMWVIDPFLTSQNGYFFETNPAGLMADALLSPAGQNRQWDGIWNEHVQRTDKGWTIEVEIPFSTLNFDPNNTSWGFNFQRTVRRKNEESLWNGWARNQGLQRLANAGLVDGLNEDVSQGLGLDLRPYGLFTSDGADGKTSKNTGKTGFDVFYSLTPGLRANLTVNTDFAQTEVDQRLVNFTQYSLFFPEKRTFFLEGANLFDFGAVPQIGGLGGGGFARRDDNSFVPFFSRRIGIDASGNPQRINYGGKMFGQIGRAEVGLLQVQTGEEEDLSAPSEDYTVLRVKRRVLRQSYFGGMYTLRNNHTPGIDALQTFGADFQVATSTFKGNRNLSGAGFVLNSTNPLGTGKNSAFSARVDYPNDRWNAGISYRGVQENFAPALGFTTRSNYQQYNPYLNFSPRPRSHRLIRQLGFTAEANLQTDMANEPLSRVWTLTPLSVNLHSQDNFSVQVITDYERLDRNFTIAINPTSRVTLFRGREFDFLRYRISGQTANRRKIAIQPVFEWGSFYSGTRQQVSTNITLRARTGVIAYFSQEWNRVNLPEGKFETRLYRFTPELQFNQWISFVNTVQYDTVSAVVGWQARLRWILKPGNDLYVVYTHNWIEDTGLDRFSTLTRRAASKFSYTLRF
jgi:hypothetical protein